MIRDKCPAYAAYVSLILCIIIMLSHYMYVCIIFVLQYLGCWERSTNLMIAKLTKIKRNWFTDAADIVVFGY